MEFGDDIKSFRFSWLFYRTSYQGKQSYDIIATVAKVLDPSKAQCALKLEKSAKTHFLPFQKWQKINI